MNANNHYREPNGKSEFRPFPFLSNRHVQTLLGHWLPGPRCPRPERRHVLWLLDGDGLLLHENIPSGWQPGKPVALLVHGLTGSHASRHIQRLAAMLLRRRVRTVRMDLRGTGMGLTLARNAYHAGRSSDLRAILVDMSCRFPGSPLYLVGVSFGGALALRLAGEAADDPIAQLVRVAALAPPIDLEACSAQLALPANRLYENNFVRDLVAEARRRHQLFPDQAAPRFPRRTTVRQFDDLYTAPRNGFADALDYYRRASAAPLIGRIMVPTLVLTARDDPFIAVKPFEDLRVPTHVSVRIMPHGGHVGFLGWDGANGIRWADRHVVEWLTS
jgi:predicted alpha/beta-fold hydrolase